MGLKYTKRAMTSYEVHRFFHSLEISFFPDTFSIITWEIKLRFGYQLICPNPLVTCQLPSIYQRFDQARFHDLLQKT